MTAMRILIFLFIIMPAILTGQTIINDSLKVIFETDTTFRIIEYFNDGTSQIEKVTPAPNRPAMNAQEATRYAARVIYLPEKQTANAGRQFYQVGLLDDLYPYANAIIDSITNKNYVNWLLTESEVATRIQERMVGVWRVTAGAQTAYVGLTTNGTAIQTDQNGQPLQTPTYGPGIWRPTSDESFYINNFFPVGLLPATTRCIALDTDAFSLFWALNTSIVFTKISQ